MIGVLVDKADGLRKVTFEDQDVVSEIVLGEEADTVIEIGAEDVVIIRLVLQYVTDGAEFGVCGTLFENGGDIGANERHPSNDGLHEIVLGGEFEEPARFFQRLAGLDCDG